jgi:hypothetical protein
MKKINNNNNRIIMMERILRTRMAKTKNLMKIVITIVALNSMILRMTTKTHLLKVRLSHRISLSSKCNLDKGGALKWIIWWTEKSNNRKTTFGKIKGKIISEISKTRKMIKSISKVVREGINLTVILIKHNHSTMSKRK